MNKIYYLAYGSNLNLRQMRRRCPDAEVVGTTELQDYRLMFKGSKTGSYLTVEKAKGYKVPLGVWLVSEQDLARLDVYEGYPAFYYRKRINILVEETNATQAKCEAIIYIMHEDRELGVPSNQYVETCVEGYKDFGFDIEYLIDAFNYSKEGDKKNGNKR